MKSIDDFGSTESAEQRIARHQRGRLRWLGLAGVSYALQIILVAIISCLGGISAVFALGYAAAHVAIVGLFYIVFRAGWNLRLRAPNLTLAQVLAPALPGLILLYQVDSLETRAALVITAIVPLLYGTLDLTMTSFVAAATLYSVGFLSTTLGHDLILGRQDLMRHNWILLTAILVVWPQVVLISSLVNRLRRTLRQRNQQLKEATRRLSGIAVRDELTGLYNRRWLMEVFERERLIIQRREYAFCVAMIDVDYFKAINDAHGHPVGDRVLRELGRYLAEQVRDIDGFGRFGGEEFLWIMPDTELDAALGAAERLRCHAGALSFSGDDGSRFSVTLSIGVAQNDHSLALSNDALLRRADAALYTAKQRGRNQVVCAPTEAFESDRIIPDSCVQQAS